MPSTRVTSHDVARLAGVSQATVSYALSGKGSVSEETRRRVEEAARSLRYRPNAAARAMRTGRTGRVAVVAGIPLHNPSRMLEGAGKVAAEAGLGMEVQSFGGDLESYSERVLDLASSGQFDGILCFVPLLSDVLDQAPADVPIVQSTSFSTQMHTVGSLADATPLATMMERLATLGHRRFLHVAGPDEYPSAVARRETYLATIERLGAESLGVAAGDWTGESGLAAVLALPDDAPPLAVIAANDLVAVGVMRGATQRGWTVPGDISVTGWDNYDVSAFLTPTLTTVDVDRGEDGRRGMRRLVAEIRGTEPPAESDEPLTRVIWRESTAAPRAS